MYLEGDILTVAKGLCKCEKGIGTVWLPPKVTFEKDQCLLAVSQSGCLYL